MLNIFGLSIHDMTHFYYIKLRPNIIWSPKNHLECQIIFCWTKIIIQNRYDRYNSLFSLGEVQGGGSELFDKMYGGAGNFTRGQFYYHSNPIEFKSGSYKIVGEMGKTHESEIKIQILKD